MGVVDTAEKNILKRKMFAEKVADENLNLALQNEDLRIVFVKCKKLVVDIARAKLEGKDTTELRNEYNKGRQIIAKILKANGISKDDLKIHYSCNKCDDTGYVNGMQCECLKKEISNELARLGGIDLNNFARFDDNYSVFEDKSTAKTLYNKMRKFIDNASTTKYDVVLLVGNTGVGKTHLMECMTTHAIDKCLTVKYSTAFNFNQDMLKYHCSNIDDKEAIMYPYLDSELLFIDDLGSENQIKNVTNEYLYLVINERMQQHKKTIISTNLDMKQIQDVYGERIFSRLMHKQQSLKINFTGNDLRIKANNK